MIQEGKKKESYTQQQPIKKKKKQLTNVQTKHIQKKNTHATQYEPFT